MERCWQGGRLSGQMHHLFYLPSFHLSSAPLLHHLGHWFCALPKFIAWRCTLHIQTSLIRSCRIITLRSKLRETSNGALPFVARSRRPVFVGAEFRLACFPRNWKVTSCVWVLSVVRVCLSYWFLWLCTEKFYLECPVFVVWSVFWSLFLGTCFVWWLACWLSMLCMFILSDCLLCPLCQHTLLFCGKIVKIFILYPCDFWEIGKYNQECPVR